MCVHLCKFVQNVFVNVCVWLRDYDCVIICVCVLVNVFVCVSVFVYLCVC